ncbi:MAG: recQ1, partial [Pseudonocardia sp.]|nr:recQ1 [Pseudonocardia sp.]
RLLLLGFFVEQVADPCGRRDYWDAGRSTRPDPAGSAEADAAGLGSEERVQHPQFGEGMVMSTEDDRVTVLFAEHGYKTLSLAAVQENALLEPME